MISDFFKQVNKLFSRRRVNVYESIETREAYEWVCRAWSFFLPSACMTRLIRSRLQRGYVYYKPG